MGDFGRAGAASLWKSGPLFSTGNSETELMTVRLRLNLQSSFCIVQMASRARKQEKD